VSVYSSASPKSTITPHLHSGQVYAILHKSGVYFTADNTTTKWPFVTCKDPVEATNSRWSQLFYVYVVLHRPYTIELTSLSMVNKKEIVCEKQSSGTVYVKSRVVDVGPPEAEWIIQNMGHDEYQYVMRAIPSGISRIHPSNLSDYSPNLPSASGTQWSRPLRQSFEQIPAALALCSD